MTREFRRGTGLALASAIWGALFVIPYRRASLIAPASQVAFALLFWAALQTSVLVLWELRRGPQPEDKTWRASILVAMPMALLAAGGNLFSAQGLSQVEPALHSVVLRAEVVFVGILGAVFLREKPSSWFVLGAATALAGLGVMSYHPTQDGVSFGVLWGVAAAACFGAMQVVVRKMVHRIALTRVNALRLWLSALLLLATPHVASEVWVQPRRFWILTFIAALCGPAISRQLMMSALRFVPAAYGALMLLLGPLLVYPLAYILDGTRPSLLQTLGGALMLLGISLPIVEALRAQVTADR